jgi:CubicO group peptidase (beta-lactamase class C family)
MAARDSTRISGTTSRNNSLNLAGSTPSSVTSIRERFSAMSTTSAKSGNPTSHWDFTEETAGCGGVRTTIGDLLRYSRAMLSASDTEEGKLLLTPVVDAGDGRRWIGLGWWLREPIAWHTGGTGGFGAFAGFNQRTQRAVALLASSPHQQWRSVDAMALAHLSSWAAGD